MRKAGVEVVVKMEVEGRKDRREQMMRGGTKISGYHGKNTSLPLSHKLITSLPVPEHLKCSYISVATT
jgi:hypothetical protein